VPEPSISTAMTVHKQPACQIVQGRLPQVTSDGTVEIALSQVVTNNLACTWFHLPGTLSIAVGSQVWNFRVVGIIARKCSMTPFGPWQPLFHVDHCLKLTLL